MTLLEFMYEKQYGIKWKDEKPEIKGFVIEGWNLALEAIKRQSELLGVENEI
jgi:hypothetical protein